MHILLTKPPSILRLTESILSPESPPFQDRRRLLWVDAVCINAVDIIGRNFYVEKHLWACLEGRHMACRGNAQE